MQASTRPAWCCQRVDETVGEQPLTGPSGMSTQEEGGRTNDASGDGDPSRPPEDAVSLPLEQRVFTARV